MIPKNQKVLDQFKNLIDKQQSNITKARTEGRKNPRYATVVGQCKCCDRDGLKMAKKIEQLCSYCYGWCKDWIKANYGYYAAKHLAEAICAFQKPIECRFCHKEIDRIRDDGSVRKGKPICDSCNDIYIVAREAGRKDRERHKYKRRDYA